MKVKRIKVTNVKAIAEQELNLNGATAILMGGNNKGKSTLLRSLKDRLLKLKADHLVRAGETSGMYVMEFTSGDRIEWELSTETKAGEKLTLISSDGSKTSVITDIIKWFSPGSFDIDKFLNESPAAQRKSLEKLLGLDFSGIDERYVKATEDRKEANRDVDRVEITYKGKYVDEKLPLEPTPTEDLQKELLGVESHNRYYAQLTGQEEELMRRQQALLEELKQIGAKLDTLDEQLSAPDLQPKTPEHVSELSETLTALKQQNIRIEENNRLRIALESLTGLKDIAHEKDLAVKDLMAEKDALIKGAKMPKGFGFADEGITYNGYPLTKEQLSSSAIYIAALKLASINVGNVRMLHFDASMLDNVSLQEVLAWAEKEDLQMGIEMVDRTGGEISYEIMEDL